MADGRTADRPAAERQALERRARRARAKARRRSRPPRWRGHVLPRSVLGIATVILAFGLGAASLGTFLYLRYDYRQNRSDALVKDFDKKIANARAVLDAETTNARGAIQSELEPLRKFAATGETLEKLVDRAAPSVMTVRTFDINGSPVIATAFVVASDATKSFLLTSYNAVRAATAKPGPDVLVRKAEDERKAQLWTWDENRDLALLIIDKGNLPRLDWAASGSARLGEQLFAVSALGSKGAAITQGFIANIDSSGLQHDVSVGTAFQGGPLLNGDGKVVAIASRAYAPFGFTSEGVFFAPAISAACEKVLSCPGGKVGGAGAQR